MLYDQKSNVLEYVPQTGQHIPQHWLEREIAQWVHHEGLDQFNPMSNAIRQEIKCAGIHPTDRTAHTTALAGTGNSSMGPPGRVRSA